MTQERLEQAIARLREYKRAKAPLENRLKEEELLWQLRHWEVIGNEKGRQRPGVGLALQQHRQ